MESSRVWEQDRDAEKISKASNSELSYFYALYPLVKTTHETKNNTLVKRLLVFVRTVHSFTCDSVGCQPRSK